MSTMIWSPQEKGPFILQLKNMYIRLLPATFEPLTKEIMKYRYIFKIFPVGKLLIELSQNSQTLETAY